MQENFDKGLIYPPFTNIRKISAHIAAKVAAKAYELGKRWFQHTLAKDNILVYFSQMDNRFQLFFCFVVDGL